MALPDKDMMAAIAATRFGLGAKPGEIEAAKADPVGYLRAQVRREGADQPTPRAPSSVERLAGFREYQQTRQQERRDGNLGKSAPPVAKALAPAMAAMSGEAPPAMAAQADAPKRDPIVAAAAKLLREDLTGDFMSRIRLASTTDAAFRERWTLFWANHFTVSSTKVITGTVIGPFEEEAIRPNVFGSFEQLLVASSTHPAMLTYLDQFQSVGPNSFGARLSRRGVGLNENLAREIMELHTVGVDAGYTQADVTEFAKAMTGLGIGLPRDPESFQGRTVFHDPLHEPGIRKVMGKSYAEMSGKGQTLAILHDLAHHPATARHVSVKLARHFVADTPPPALVDRLTRTFMETDGDLAKLAYALVDSPEAWDPTPAKFKTPYEFLVSSYRAAGGQPNRPQEVLPLLSAMGQKPFNPPSPKGWAEEAEVWCAPDAIVKRMAWVQAAAPRVAQAYDPNQFAQNALGARLTPAVAKAVSRAETRAEGVSIALMSPEFQRR